MTGRFLALHLSELATDRIRRSEPDLPPDRPLATWAASGSRRLLVAVDRAAAGAGLRPGGALADAQAILPDLILRPADPVRDGEVLRSLAHWARRYTPLTATDPPDGLILDITGCGHLWGGEAALLADVLARLRRFGIAARGAVAGAAATAAALARARDDNPVAVSGIEEAVVAPLPLGGALRLPQPVLEALARLGLRQVHHLLALPRGPLARRFGRDLLDRLDAVTGRRTAPVQPVAPPPELVAVRELLEPVITRTAIDAVLDRLLDDLCGRLRRAGLGARRVALLAWRVDGAVQEVAVGTGLAMREPAHLRRLFAELLGGLEPGLGFERMALEARVTEGVAAGIQGGFGVVGRGGGAEAAMALAQLLDRLRQRLLVQRVAPLASHWPEHSVAALDPHGTPPAMPPGWIAQPWPVLLLRRPQPLEVVALLSDEPPSLLRWRGQAYRLRWAEGPLRLEPEWWRAGSGPRRDYYRVELPSGTRLWVCRAGGRWLLHGHLP